VSGTSLEPLDTAGHELVTQQADFRDTELVVPRDMPYADWHRLLLTLGRLSRSSSWWIGDAILHGEAAYGEQYAQAVEDTGLARQTLINYTHVCRSVPPERRRGDLSFGHHEAVTMLQPHEQEAWLQAALDNQWSRQLLREQIMAHRGGGGSQPQPTPGHQQAAAAVDAAAAAAGTRPAPAAPVVPASPPTGAQVLAAAAADTLDALARDLYGAAVELEAAWADAPNTEYMAVPVLYLRRLADLLGL
jgi:hypothetical protein